MNRILSKLRNRLQPNVITLSGTLLVSYILSLIYTSYYWTEYQQEFESYSVFEVSMILCYRGLLNMSFGTLVVPIALGNYFMVGVYEGGSIILNEIQDIPNILRKIFNSWLITLIWDTIKDCMMALGTFIEPYFTLLVRFSIYIGLLALLVGIILFNVKWIKYTYETYRYR